MPAWVGTATGNKAVSRAVVGTATGNKEVTQIWVGTTGGNKLVWQAVGDLALQAAAAGPYNVTTSWADPGGGVDSYRLHVNGTYRATVTGLSYNVGGLTPNTTYTFRVDAYNGARLLTSDTAQATTTNLVLETRQATVSPGVANSYESGRNINGDANPTSVNDGYRTNTRLYHGLYSPSSWGINRSKLWFPVPADLRNCYAVDKVYVSLQNLHSYYGDYITFGIGLHNGGGAEPTIGQTTGAFATFDLAKGASTGWWDITNRAVAGTTVKEYFRIYNGLGFTLEPTTTDRRQYGYFATTAQMFFEYRVQV